MKHRLAFVALVPLLTACASDRVTGVAAERAARQYQAQVIAPSEEPLFFLDGKEITAVVARGLAPASIASLEVIKSAAAIAVYGERGSRGVILITSKATVGGAAR
jgi:TonB-dependent SusC/RagA subfamily outer membrane receptor